MKKNLLAFLAVALTASTGTSFAQTSDVVVDTKNGVSPYSIDSRNIIVRTGTGLCLRTGYWTKDLAQSIKTVGDNLPVGCSCEKELFDKAVCEKAPMVAAAPAEKPAAKPVMEPKAAPEPAPKPAAQKVSLPSDALFAYDKADLSMDGKNNLSSFATSAKALGGLEVIIAVGHADRIGSANYNQALSEKRAASVKDFLISQGIPANKIYTEGKGEDQPVTGASCDNMGSENGKNKKLIDCLAKDRRVELEAVGTK